MRQTMKHTLSLISLFFLTSPAVCQEASPPHWYADFDKATAAAEKEGKDLLVDFTGSDWCGWCIRLDEEVFEHEVPCWFPYLCAILQKLFSTIRMG